jgi:hypothetical protein
VRRALFIACVVLASCRKEAPRALLDDAAGLAPGSRVFAAGLHVGDVERVTLVDDRAEVRLTLADGHSLAPRADACALVLEARGVSALLVFPGKELASLEGPIRSCDAQARRPELQRLSESGNETLRAGARHALLVLDLRHDAPPDGPCDALAVSRLRTEQVEPVALLLPEGGRRLWLSVENRARTPVAVETATFLDTRGTVAPQARLPETDDLFLSVSIPAGARREVSVVFEGRRAAQVQTVEVEAAYVDTPGETCRARWRL